MRNKKSKSVKRVFEDDPIDHASEHAHLKDMFDRFCVKYGWQGKEETPACQEAYMRYHAGSVRANIDKNGGLCVRKGSPVGEFYISVILWNNAHPDADHSDVRAPQ